MIDRLPPFAAATLKVTRAQRHIAELRENVARFLSEKPATIIAEQSLEWKKQSAFVWTVRNLRAPPPELSAIIGDTIHNLRTALDLMATDLVRLNGGNTNQVYFPFAKNAAELEDQIRRKNMHRASPDVVKLLRSVKPYTGGDAALRAIHDLDIDDKHKALIPAVGAMTTPPMTLFMNGQVNAVPAWDTPVTYDGQMFMVMPVIENVPLGSELPATFRLIFRSDSPFAGREIIPTLESLCEHITSTIEAFATLCVGRSWLPEPEIHQRGRKTLLVGHAGFAELK